MTSSHRQLLVGAVAGLVTLLVGCTSPSPAATSDPARPGHAAEAVTPAGAKETALAVREFPPGESWDEAVQPLIVRISNQAFDDPDVRLTATLDGVALFNQSFAVEGQHTVTLFGVEAEPGRHTLTVVSDSGAQISQTVTLPAGSQRWLVVDYWYVDPGTADASRDANETPGPVLTVVVSEEPVYIA